MIQGVLQALCADLATRTVIERRFVQINCALKVAPRCFVVGVLNELIVAKRNQAVAAHEAERDKDRQPTEPELVGRRHCRQFAYL